jgi:hypothetical protein
LLIFLVLLQVLAIRLQNFGASAQKVRHHS